MWKEFREFALKGNVLDLAVGVMIGAAFGKIVTSAVNDIFMPLLSLLTGDVDFSGLFIAMDGGDYASIDVAKEVGVATFNYGAFLTAIIDFLLIALCIFLFIKLIARVQRKKKEEPAAKTPRKCPFCLTEIAEEAVRCPHCTSMLEEAK